MQTYIDRPDGVRLHCAIDPAAGAKAAVMIIHGFTEHGAHYSYAAQRLLSAGYTVYRPDSRGHGLSASGSGPLDGYTIMDYVADTDAVVEHIRHETGLPVFMLGHSMGALIACAYGVTYHDRLAGQLTTGALYESPPALADMPGLDNIPDDAVLQTMEVPGMVRAEDAADPLIVKAIAMGYARRVFLDGPDYVQRNIKQHRYPVLMVHGQQDKMVPFGASFRFLSESGSQDKTLILRPNAGHSMLREKDEQAPVLDAMIAWLDSRAAILG